LFRNYDRRVRLYSFTATSRDFEVLEAGKQRMAVGRVHVRSRVTGEEDVVSFVVLYFGGHNLLASAREFVADDTFALMKKDFGAAFAKGDTPALLRLMEEHFNHGGYSLWHLFKDEQRVVVDKILTSAVAETMAVYRQVFNRHLSVMHVVDKLRIPPPRAFSSLAEFVLNTDIREALEGGERDLEKLRSAVSRIKRFSLQIDGPKISYVVSSVLNGLLADFARDPSSSDLIAEAVDILETVEGLSLHLNLWKAQNIYFSVGKRELAAVRKAAASGDAGAREWEKSFLRLGEHLKISTD
ncbi:MAG: DUF3536 domain-containing protein, partial [Candidatus Omnitrophica bacterium]|nr:DUF3536 domain-containing protein [Candidatus Omnitrophota bacterium]